LSGEAAVFGAADNDMFNECLMNSWYSFQEKQ
jgi:hypothetical protein